MGLFRRPSLSRMLGISAAKAKLSRQLGFSITQAAKGKFVPTKPPRVRRPSTRHSPSTSALSFDLEVFESRPTVVAVAEPSDPEAIVVRAAEPVQMPAACASCLGPADEYDSVVRRRSTWEAQAWAVPHCSDCREFERLRPLIAEASAGVEEAREAGESYIRQVQGEVVAILSRLTRRGEELAAWKPPTLAMALVVVVSGGFLLSLVGQLFSLWAFAAVLLLTGAVAVPVVLRWPDVEGWFCRRHDAEARANAEELRLEQAEAQTALAQASAEAKARLDEAMAMHAELRSQAEAVKRPGRLKRDRVMVEYLGQEEIVHCFAFGNREYAVLFQQANAGGGHAAHCSGVPVLTESRVCPHCGELWSGRWRHAKTDGGPDRRFKDNPYCCRFCHGPL